jgi:predicted GNAT superfamily acetyltransferase
MTKKSFREVKVVVERTYLIPVYGQDGDTTFDGRGVDELVRDWFTNYDINRHHAARDAYHVGGGDKVLFEPTIGPVLKEGVDV